MRPVDAFVRSIGPKKGHYTMKSLFSRASYSCVRGSIVLGWSLVISTMAWDAMAAENERLFFASDVHGQTQNLSSSIDALCQGSCDLVGLVGDYGEGLAQQDPDGYLSQYAAVYSTVQSAAPNAQWVLAQGNHDMVTGSTAGDPRYQFYTHGSGIAYSGQYYQVYVLDVQDFQSRVDDLRMNACAEDGRVLVVMAHYPLHTNRPIAGLTTEQQESLQAAILGGLHSCTQVRDIVYLWGHDHSDAKWDVGVNYVVGGLQSDGAAKVMGGECRDSDIEEEKCKRCTLDTCNVFPAIGKHWPTSVVMLNAGYVKPRAGGGASSATLLTIDADRILVKRIGDQAQEVSFTRLSGYSG